MQLPKISAPLVLSGVALVVSVSGVGAAATGLINGASIKPGTITGRQIRNHSVPVVKLGGAVPTSFPKYLPVGATVRGTYEAGGTAAGSGSWYYSAISWFWPLRAPVSVRFVPIGGPSTKQCPGTGLAPAAARGYLCVYARYTAGSPSGPFASQNITRTGITFYVGSTAATLTFNNGTWAVTGN